MKKLESTFTNMVLSLVLIAVVAAAALAGVFTLTNDKIEQQKNEKRQKAIKEVVLPNAGEGVAVTIASTDTIDPCVVHTVLLNGEFIGSAVETSGVGFGGTQKIMVGFNADGEVINYSVLEHQETPGLGDHIKEWFKEPKKAGSYILGRKAGDLVVSKDGGDVDAITAATISSRAFLKAVNTAYNAIANQHVEAASGDTVQTPETPESQESPETPESPETNTEKEETL